MNPHLLVHCSRRRCHGRRRLMSGEVMGVTSDTYGGHVPVYAVVINVHPSIRKLKSAHVAMTVVVVRMVGRVARRVTVLRSHLSCRVTRSGGHNVWNPLIRDAAPDDVIGAPVI